jgi:hypothetical protein
MKTENGKPIRDNKKKRKKKKKDEKENSALWVQLHSTLPFAI